MKEATIEASVDDWFELMSAYHEAVLGWIGGTQKVDGQEASEAAVKDRIQLIRESMEVLFAGRNRFTAGWTYITAER